MASGVELDGVGFCGMSAILFPDHRPPHPYVFSPLVNRLGWQAGSGERIHVGGPGIPVRGPGGRLAGPAAGWQGMWQTGKPKMSGLGGRLAGPGGQGRGAGSGIRLAGPENSLASAADRLVEPAGRPRWLYKPVSLSLIHI